MGSVEEIYDIRIWIYIEYDSRYVNSVSLIVKVFVNIEMNPNHKYLM